MSIFRVYLQFFGIVFCFVYLSYIVLPRDFGVAPYKRRCIINVIIFVIIIVLITIILKTNWTSQIKSKCRGTTLPTQIAHVLCATSSKFNTNLKK